MIERRVQRFGGPLLAGGLADAHERGAGLGHDRAYVREIQVDVPRNRDKIADRLDTLAQHVVRERVGFAHAHRLPRQPQESLVGDHDKRIDLLTQRRQPPLSGHASRLPFEGKGCGDDRHRERA